MSAGSRHFRWLPRRHGGSSRSRRCHQRRSLPPPRTPARGNCRGRSSMPGGPARRPLSLPQLRRRNPSPGQPLDPRQSHAQPLPPPLLLSLPLPRQPRPFPATPLPRYACSRPHREPRAPKRLRLPRKQLPHHPLRELLTSLPPRPSPLQRSRARHPNRPPPPHPRRQRLQPLRPRDQQPATPPPPHPPPAALPPLRRERMRNGG